MTRAKTGTRSRGTARGRAAKPRLTFEPTEHDRNYSEIALAYARAAAGDKRQESHCKWVRLAAQRHLDDLKRSKTRAFEFYFDPWHGNDICDVIEKLPHIEGNWCTCARARSLILPGARDAGTSLRQLAA